jgi:hypothetical protein
MRLSAENAEERLGADRQFTGASFSDLCASAVKQ